MSARSACHGFVLDALLAEAQSHGPDLKWIERERQVVAIAANQWAEAHGYERRVTVADVERVEARAVGHIDYATKLALYVTDLVVA